MPGLYLKPVKTQQQRIFGTIARSRAPVHNDSAVPTGPIMETIQESEFSHPRRSKSTKKAGRFADCEFWFSLTIETIAGGDLSAEEAAGMIAATRRVALEMFPGKERAFDLIYRPQFQRVMHAIYRLQ